MGTQGAYELEGRELIAETDGLRVQVLTVGNEQCGPWHRYTTISDTFFCLRGPMLISTREPVEVRRLECGERMPVPPGQPHQVAGVDGQGCCFGIVQGVGTYDYIPED